MRKIKINDKMMRKVKIEKETKIDYFFNYDGRSLVRIAGDFPFGGFAMTKEKIKAVLKLAKELKPFLDGQYDKQILSLEENKEGLKP